MVSFTFAFKQALIVGVGVHNDVRISNHVGVGILGDAGAGVGVGIDDDGLKVVVHFCLIVTFQEGKNLLDSTINSTSNHY